MTRAPYQPRWLANFLRQYGLVALAIWLIAIFAVGWDYLARSSFDVLLVGITMTVVSVLYSLTWMSWSDERRRVVETLRQSEEKFRNLVESTTDYIWETDAKRRFSYVSPRIRDLLGYEPGEIIGRSPLDLMRPAEAKRMAAVFAAIVPEKRPFAMLEHTLLRKDGTEVVLETSGVPVLDEHGALQGYRGIDRDITERKQTRAALEHRDALLHAVTLTASGLLTTPSLDDAISRSLEIVGKLVGVDRVLVIEVPIGPGGVPHPSLRYAWQSADAPVKIEPAFFQGEENSLPELAAWYAPILEGKSVTTLVSTSTGAVRQMMEGLGNLSILLVPIVVDGESWGTIGFDDCKRERAWAPSDVDILKTLATLIGTSIMRARYVQELADANTIVENTPTILYRVRGEPSLPMTYVSRNITLLGHDPAEMIASPCLYQSYVHPDDAEKVLESMARALEKDAHPSTVDFRLRTGQGDYRWVENRFTPIRDAAGRLIEVEGILIDVTERKAAEEKIALLARSDALTGLANRTTFIDRLRQMFAEAKRDATPFAVFYLDLDRFKDVNDSLGHTQGDLLLRAVAERLKNATRETDLVARLGGDEFALLQTGVSDPTTAGALATKVLRLLAVPYVLDGNELRVTASIGIAPFDPEIARPEDMLAQADLALYRAKEEGRDQYRFHSVDLDYQVRERVALADDLRKALDRDELELYYQPQVELASGEIVGIEALLRWNHPTRGLLGPADFVPIAEKTGSILALGEWVLDRACRQMKLWRDAGIAPPILAVNLAIAQLKSGRKLVENVVAMIARWGLVSTELELDVSESMLARATLEQNDALERLRQIGVRIAIDDFGAQYSSLDCLKTFHVSRVKIPRSMIGSATKNPGDAAMVRAIIGIARELDIEVVAQGVETEDQRAFLASAAATAKAQGSYFSMAVQADRAADLLQRRRVQPAARRSA